jgi:hypothetical protein
VSHLTSKSKLKTVKQKCVNKKARGQGNKRKKASKKSDKAKANKLEDNNKNKSKFSRDRSPFKYYNYNKIGHMS